ncbi:MAG: DUF2997 domain-containing protein [Thermodesulfobacteriota bacterium]
MKKTTIEFVVGRDGRIRSRVLGVKGPDCRTVSDALKQGLGKVVSAEKTAEYFETARTGIQVHLGGPDQT